MTVAIMWVVLGFAVGVIAFGVFCLWWAEQYNALDFPFMPRPDDFPAHR